METQLNEEFRSLMRKHRSLVQNYLSKFHLYWGQPRLLFILEKYPNISQQQLSEMLEISKEAASVSIRRLERNNFIKRSECDKDRRVNLLKLSDQGYKIVKELRLNFDSINSQMFVDLSAKDLVELERMLKVMNKSLEKRLDDEKII